MVDEVLEMAVTLGKCEESQELRALCQTAVGELTGLLREGVSPDDCGEAFAVAGAWMALAARETAGSGGVESFTAGAVSIRKGDAASRGAALRLQAMQVMKPYLKDDGFVFRGVEG